MTDEELEKLGTKSRKHAAGTERARARANLLTRDAWYGEWHHQIICAS